MSEAPAKREDLEVIVPDTKSDQGRALADAARAIEMVASGATIATLDRVFGQGRIRDLPGLLMSARGRRQGEEGTTEKGEGVVLVVIPTYNERENITRITKVVLAQEKGLEILIVDDGSPDGTGDMADRMAARDERIHVIHRAGKLGLGSAYVAGFKWALERKYRFIFEMDADFSHDPEKIPEFLDAAANADLVLGSRYRNGRVNVVNWPLGRLALSYAANIYTRTITGMAVSDATGGFKCFRRSVLENLDLDKIASNGYAFQIEMTFRALRKGARVAEVPIVFIDRAEGTSKMNPGIAREAIWMVWWLKIQALLNRL